MMPRHWIARETKPDRRLIAAGFRAAYCSAVLAVIAAIAVPARGADELLHPLESADTSSPRATLQSFLDACHMAYQRMVGERRQGGQVSTAERAAVANRILRCLDTSDLPPAVRQSLAKEAAVCLKEVFDRIELPPESEWPDAEALAEDESTRWTIPHTEITIAKITEGPRAGEFLFTRETVDRAKEFYERIQSHDYIERDTTTRGFYDWYLSEPGWMIPQSWFRSLPAWARARWFGQAIWQWCGLLATLLAGLAAMVLMYIVGRRRARLLESYGWRNLSTLSFPIAAMLIPLAARWFVIDQVRISGYTMVAVSFALQLAFLLGLIVVLIGVGNRLAQLVVTTTWIEPGGLDAQFARLACRVLSIVAAAVVFLEGGRQMGIPLTTLVAGAGVGGLTVALAAQDAMKNIFGSMMIILDKPYKVGERIVVKRYDGFVEEIGLRSTKLRLLTGHQVSIPNEEMARSDVENIGRRPHIRRVTNIAIAFDTPPEKIERAIEIVRDVLRDHEGMDPNFPPRVYFDEFNRDSFNIRVFVWRRPPDFWEFMEFSQRLNQQIVAAFAAEGIRFALPATTTYWASREQQSDSRSSEATSTGAIPSPQVATPPLG